MEDKKDNAYHEMLDKLYGMKIHERWQNNDMMIIRVTGGWLYRDSTTANGGNNVFVPYDDVTCKAEDSLSQLHSGTKAKNEDCQLSAIIDLCKNEIKHNNEQTADNVGSIGAFLDGVNHFAENVIEFITTKYPWMARG